MAESIPPRVYSETTIPSFYHEVRAEPEMVARRNWTRTWWDDRRHVYQLVTEVRHRISQQYGHDPKKLIAYYIQLQAKHKDRLLEEVHSKTPEAAPSQA